MSFGTIGGQNETALKTYYSNTKTKLKATNVQDAIDEIYAKMFGDLRVRVQVYETGTTTPIPGVLVNGIYSETGGPVYANSSGIAEGIVLSDEKQAQTTVQVGTDYIDLSKQTSQTVTAIKGSIVDATIYATRIANPSGKIETFTSSTQKMFTDKVKRVDVHCVGGGAGGTNGRCLSSGEDVQGGNGGSGGSNKTVSSVSFQPNSLFDIIVGKGGTGGPKNSTVTNIGGRGGSTHCLGVSASGGLAGGTSGANRYWDEGNEEYYARSAGKATESTSYLFDEQSLGLVPGGNGGGGAAFLAGFTESASNGGKPSGGDGGIANSNTGQASSGLSGKTAGGGGGGGAGLHRGMKYGGAGGDGGPGIVYVRWFY